MMRIPQGLLRRIAGHGETTYPEECCGLLLGLVRQEDLTVQEVVSIDNRQDTNKRRRFLITPEQYREAERTAEGLGMTLLGFYHSHPDHPAAPSAFDTEHALPWFSYVIVSVVRGTAGEATAWRLREDRSRFEQLPFSVVDEPLIRTAAS